MTKIYYDIFLTTLEYDMTCKIDEHIKESSPNMIEKTKENNIKEEYNEKKAIKKENNRRKEQNPFIQYINI